VVCTYRWKRVVCSGNTSLPKNVGEKRARAKGEVKGELRNMRENERRLENKKQPQNRGLVVKKKTFAGEQATGALTKGRKEAETMQVDRSGTGTKASDRAQNRK
jgi:hypothetical protein